MVRTLTNFLTEDDIIWFKADWQRYFAAQDYTVISCDADDTKRKYGLDNWTIRDRRRELMTKDPAWNKLAQMIRRVIPSDVRFWVGYQRQYIPHSMHIDEPGPDSNPEWLYSVIVPLDTATIDVAKTIVWRKQFNRFSEYLDFQSDFIHHPENYTPVSNVSELYDVDHCMLNKNPADYFELDGVYDYALGTAGMFDRCNLHCSSNWRRHGIAEYKDIIIYHIG